MTDAELLGGSELALDAEKNCYWVLLFRPDDKRRDLAEISNSTKEVHGNVNYINPVYK